MTSQSSLPSGAQRTDQAVKSFGRRGGGVTFAVMITVLLVAIVFAANQNEVIGWIVVAISAAWLVLAAVVVFSVRRGAKKIGETLTSARADAAAQRGGGTAVVDEDAHSRNMKLDHSFKIVQVQKRVITQELAKGDEADFEMIERALETIDITAHNGRDMLADLVGRGEKKNDGPGAEDDERTGEGRTSGGGDDDHRPDGGTISGEVIR